MPDRPRATVELYRREPPIAGAVTSRDATHEFTGWTGLLAALEHALELETSDAVFSAGRPNVGTTGDGEPQK